MNHNQNNYPNNFVQPRYDGYYPQNQMHPQQKPRVKRSGATYSKISKGNHVGSTIVNAWNKIKGRGLITAKVAPYKDTKVYENAKGETKQTMIAEVFYHNSGITKIIPCSMNQATQVIVLSELGMCISPNGNGYTSSGKIAKGYFGTFNKS